ncbi:MAG: hypothetical protein HYT70_03960 [Candidatus Aenigmarchaeota archaeon]|nr:hypothetical protein [Candidatus Aenigmarchaeota archaeon]
MARRLKPWDTMVKSFEISMNNPELFWFLVLLMSGLILFLVGVLLLFFSVASLHVLSLFIGAVIMLASLVLLMGGIGGTILYAERLVKRKKASVWTIMKKGITESPRLSLAYVLEQGFIMLGLLLLIIPGLIVAVRLSLVTPACILEKKGLGIKRSWRATKGNSWQIALLLLVWGLIFMLFAIIPFFIVASFLLLPVYLVNLTLVYLQLKKK